MASRKNKTASTIVILCKIRSIPRTFCFPKSCSAPPEIAPDNPVLFPGWSSMTAINRIESMISNVNNNVCTTAHLLRRAIPNLECTILGGRVQLHWNNCPKMNSILLVRPPFCLYGLDDEGCSLVSGYLFCLTRG